MTQTFDEFEDSLIEMAYCYASTCTQQEEKFGFVGSFYMNCHMPYTWQDSKAAYEMLKKDYGFSGAFDKRDDFLRQNAEFYDRKRGRFDHEGYHKKKGTYRE